MALKKTGSGILIFNSCIFWLIMVSVSFPAKKQSQNHLGTATISGHINEQSITPTPIAGATINVYNEQIEYNTTSNPSGWYEIVDVEAGTYTITCSAVGYVSDTLFDVFVGDGEAIDADFELMKNIPAPANVVVEYFDEEHTGITITWQEEGIWEINRYEIYRLEEGEENNQELWVLLDDNLTDTTYFDDLWQLLDPDRYVYAVIADCESGQSLPGFSNGIDRGHQLIIRFVYYSDLYDENTLFLLINRDNNPEHQYIRVSENGFFILYDVWPGLYDLYIQIPGLNPYSLLGFGIYSDMTINITGPSSYWPPREIIVNNLTMELCWHESARKYDAIFKEDFEQETLPVGWSQEFIEGSLEWEIFNGSPSGEPPKTYFGDYNASLYGETGSTILVTPALNLEDVVTPVMTFWYTLAQHYPYDSLSVYYKDNTDSEWTFLQEYHYPSWTWRGGKTEITEFSDQCYLGFKGFTSSADSKGICLDKVALFRPANYPNTLGGYLEIEGYNVYLDDEYFNFYLEDGCHTLQDISPGQHIIGVNTQYACGTSITIEESFYFTPCNYLNQPGNFSGFIDDFTVTLTWEEPDSIKTTDDGKKTLIKKSPDSDEIYRYELLGYNIWYFDEVLTFLPDSVYEFVDILDIECDSNMVVEKYYNITAVYTEGESCLINPPFMAVTQWDFPMPENTCASLIEVDSVLITWSPASDPTVAGYNVYRNRQYIVFTDDTLYIEPVINMGFWKYEVTAVLESGAESCYDGPAMISYMINGINGVVEDAVTKKRLNGVNVIMDPCSFATTSNENGKYVLHDIPAGSYEVQASLPGYYTMDFDVMIDPLGLLRKDILLADSSLSEMPFIEPWDSSSFVYQGWSFDSIQGLWHIDEETGNPMPCVSFSGLHQMDDYSCALVTNVIDATQATGNAFLGFDLNVGAGQFTGTEYLQIEIWNGEEWDSCTAFSNIADTGWIHCIYDVSDMVLGRVTQIKFIAFGANSNNLGHWQIDNVVLKDRVMGSLSGTVTNTAGWPLEGILINIDDQEVITDENGDWFMDLLAGDHTVRINTEGYNVYENTIYVLGDVSLDITMTQPVIETDPQSIYVESWGGIETRDLEVTNNGSGSANWRAWIDYEDQRMPDLNFNMYLRTPATDDLSDIDLSLMTTQISGLDSRDTWDLLFEYDITTTSSGLRGQSGIEFTGSAYYVTQWNQDRINKYDVNGKYIGSFEIQGASKLRDITWDGEYLYGGSIDPWFYQLDTNDMAVSMIISAPVEVRGIAYDKQEDAFWMCDWNTDIYLVNRQGTTIDTIINPGIESIYGIAYDNFTGPPSLWLFIQGDPGGTLIQVDIETDSLTGCTQDVLSDVNTSGYAVAGGAFLSTEVVPGVVTLGGLIQAENDIIFGYELKPSSWLSLEKYSGWLEAGESEIIEIRFDGEELTWEELYEAKIRFTSDPNVPVEEVDVGFVLITAIEDPGVENGFRIYPNPAGEQLFVELSDEIKIITIYDNNGRQVYSKKTDKNRSITINTTTFKTGLYLIEVLTENQHKIVRKVVIIK